MEIRCKELRISGHAQHRPPQQGKVHLHFNKPLLLRSLWLRSLQKDVPCGGLWKIFLGADRHRAIGFRTCPRVLEVVIDGSCDLVA